MLTYRNFGKVDFYGLDASFQYISDLGLNLFGNISIVSDDFFDAEELELLQVLHEVTGGNSD